KYFSWQCEDRHGRVAHYVEAHRLRSLLSGQASIGLSKLTVLVPEQSDARNLTNDDCLKLCGVTWDGLDHMTSKHRQCCRAQEHQQQSSSDARHARSPLNSAEPRCCFGLNEAMASPRVGTRPRGPH